MYYNSKFWDDHILSKVDFIMALSVSVFVAVSLIADVCCMLHMVRNEKSQY